MENSENYTKTQQVNRQKAAQGNKNSQNGQLPSSSPAEHYTPADFEEFFDTAHDPASFLDQNYTYQAVNTAYERYFGKNREDLVGLSVAELMGEALFIEQIKPNLDRCLQGETVSYESWFEFPHMGKRYMNVVYSPRRDKRGEIVGALHISRDLTENKNLEMQIQEERDKLNSILSSRALQESEEKYRAIFENSMEGVLLAEVDSLRIDHVNPAFCRMLGYDQEEIVGQTILQIHPESAQDRALSEFQAQARGEKTLATDMPCLRKDGSTMYANINTKKVVIGDVEYNLGIFSDITESKRFKKELVAAKEKAEAADRAKSEFLANMSHEIKTPLHGITNFLQLLQATHLNAEQQEYVDVCLKSSTRLSKLLSDILDFARFETGRLELKQEEFNLEEVMNSIQAMFKYEIQQKELNYNCYLDPKIPDSLIGDSTRLTQVLLNLVGNACKNTNQGYVNIEVSAKSLDKAKCELLFSISDSGSGVPDELQEHIFGSFTQANASSSLYARKHGGAGLGLSLAKAIVNLMGGSIFIESQVDQGTVVFIILPFEPSSRPTHSNHKL